MAKPRVYLVSLKDPTKRYEVLKFNQATNTATLQGKYAPFEKKPFTKAQITKDGYRLVREEEMTPA